MNLRYFVSAVIVGLIVIQPTALATELTLREALSKALQGNSDLKKYPYQQRMAAAGRLQASLKPNPTMGLELENVAGTGRNKDLSAAEATLSFSQLIEMGDKRNQRIKYASAAEKKITAEFEYSKVEVLAETASRFYRVIELQRLFAWNKQQQARLHDTLEIAEERIDAGAIPSSEATRIRLEVRRAQTKEQDLEGRINEAKVRLAAMWASTSNFSAVQGEMNDSLPLPSQAQVEQAANQAPEFLRLIDEERLVNARSQATIADATADLTFGVGARYNNEFDDTSLVFKLSMPLQLNNPNQGRIEAHSAEREMLLDQQRIIREQIRSYGRALLIRMQTNQGYLENIRQALLPLANQLAEETLSGYQRGNQTLLQVLDAQNELAKTEYEQIKRRSAIYQDSIELERLTGQPLLEVSR
ncbi:MULTISPECIES: TolC family protein [Idiomarina]|uniref:TolC family protein n=1 Tax=Idiomarina TaxID=135575 RepID=UPI00241E2C8C|nr:MULTISPECIES: TolC family protein [Idiomarina]